VPDVARVSNPCEAVSGGVVRNTPENLIRWVKDPPAIDPKTAMPKPIEQNPAGK